MKKIYNMMMLALMSMTLFSCSNWDYRDTPYYIDDIMGSWVSYYGHDGYGDYDIYGYDVVRYDFYSNYTGRYTYYSAYGLSYVDFDWDTRGNRLFIRYYDGDFEDLYYGYDNYGYLILSLDRYFYQYTAYRPAGAYYEQGKELTNDGLKRMAPESASVKIKALSRGVKARETEAQAKSVE